MLFVCIMSAIALQQYCKKDCKTLFALPLLQCILNHWNDYTFYLLVTIPKSSRIDSQARFLIFRYLYHVPCFHALERTLDALERVSRIIPNCIFLLSVAFCVTI